MPDGKQKELSDAIALCSGLWLDATSDKYAVTPGGGLKFEATALNRDHLAVQVKSIDIEGIAPATTKNKFGDVLPFNEPQGLHSHHHHSGASTVDRSRTGWWRRSKGTPTPSQISSTSVLLRTRRCSMRTFHLRIESEDVEVVRPVAYRYIERAQGELTRPVVVEPPVALQWSEAAMLFPQKADRTAKLQVKANIPKAAGKVRIQIPAGLANIGEIGTFPVG